jgi:hypothetical protein
MGAGYALLNKNKIIDENNPYLFIKINEIPKQELDLAITVTDFSANYDMPKDTNVVFNYNIELSDDTIKDLGGIYGEFDATGYNATANNVSVTVETRGDNEGVFVIPFPKKGTAPKIVAVPVITDWMTERTKVPTTWFKTESASDSQSNE